MNNFTVLIILMIIGYMVGTLAEKRHYRSIKKREKAHLYLPAITIKDVGIDDAFVKKSKMVYGSAVISVDYFKRILAGLRNIFGGTVRSYETLIDRARREAIIRMKDMGGDADMIVNVRIETSTIGKNAHKKGVGCIEALAYGTAVFLKE